MIICAYDPGKTTGYVRAHWTTEGENQVKVLRVLEAADLIGVPAVWQSLEQYYPDVIIYERFVYRGGVNADLSGCRQEGLFDLYSHMHNTPVVVQSSTVKRFWRTEVLVANGWPRGRGMSKHQLDAARHLMQYLTFDLKEYELKR